MSVLKQKTRDKLPPEDFALPNQRKFPIHNAAHVRNAAARLEEEKKKGNVSEHEYKIAKGHIARAAKHHGVDSEYNEKKEKGPDKDHDEDDMPMKKGKK